MEQMQEHPINMRKSEEVPIMLLQAEKQQYLPGECLHEPFRPYFLLEV